MGTKMGKVNHCQACMLRFINMILESISCAMSLVIYEYDTNMND